MDQRVAPETISPTRRGFLAGLWAALPVLLAVVPFGLIFGALATDAGFDPIQAMAMTSIVVAGASQLAALQLINDGAPALIAIVTGAVVNLRMAMYSASIAAHWREVPMLWRVPAAYFLHDQSFTLSIRRYRERPDEMLSDKLGFYFGVGIATIATWIAASAMGIVVGQRIAPEWGLEFAVPVTFIALVAPLVRGRANLAAATVAVVVALIAHGLPYGLGLMLASAAGIITGMTVLHRSQA